LELQLEKVTQDRNDLQSRLRLDSQQMLDNFKSLKDQLLKSEERANTLHEKSQQLDKLNAQLRTQVARLESDLTASQQKAKSAEALARDLSAVVEGGKDFNNAKLHELKDSAEKERAKYVQKIQEDAASIKKLQEEVAGLNSEKQRLEQYKNNKKFTVKT